MLKSLTIIYACAFICLSAALYAQTPSSKVALHEVLKAEKEIKILFADSTLPKLITFVAKYETDNGYSFYLSNRDTTREHKIGKGLSFYVFEFVFNKAIEDSLKVGAAVKQATIREAWEVLWGMKNPNSGGSIAGILALANKVAVLDKYDNKFSDYDKRRALREKYVNGNGAHLEGKIAGDKLALQKLIKTEPKKYTAGKDTFKIFLYDLANLEEGNFKKLHRQVNSVDNKFITRFNNEKMLLRTQPTFSVNTIRQKYIEDSLMFISDTANVNAILKSLLQSQKEYRTYLDSCAANSICTIKNVEVQFERGFIEKIKVWVNYKDGCYIFENIYAIGFSSALNYKSLSNIRLYIRNKEFRNEPYIYLSDVIRDYDNRLANYTRDYSPADTAFVADPNGNGSDIILPRESYINIFDAKIFTDLNGTKKSNPNGLFQIELNKRFNINTARRQLGSRRADVGYANYVNLFAAVNKIEENNRELTLHNAGVTKNGVIVSPNYATNIDFIRYENYTAGFNLNAGLLDVPDGKFTLYADLGIKYAYLNIADSVIANSTKIRNPYYFPEAHTVTFSLPKLTLELFSESRINVSVSYSHNYTYLFSNNAAKQVVSYQKSDLTDNLLEKRARRSNVFELAVKLMPTKDKNTHVFARLRFYTQHGDANTSFSQIQLGYAYNWSINR
jgi:hypothetical protein